MGGGCRWPRPGGGALVKWFRAPVRCRTDFEVWLMLWAWIGIAHSEEWYPLDDRTRRYKEYCESRKGKRG